MSNAKRVFSKGIRLQAELEIELPIVNKDTMMEAMLHVKIVERDDSLDSAVEVYNNYVREGIKFDVKRERLDKSKEKIRKSRYKVNKFVEVKGKLLPFVESEKWKLVVDEDGPRPYDEAKDGQPVDKLVHKKTGKPFLYSKDLLKLVIQFLKARGGSAQMGELKKHLEKESSIMCAAVDAIFFKLRPKKLAPKDKKVPAVVTPLLPMKRKAAPVANGKPTEEEGADKKPGAVDKGRGEVTTAAETNKREDATVAGEYSPEQEGTQQQQLKEDLTTEAEAKNLMAKAKNMRADAVQELADEARNLIAEAELALSKARQGVLQKKKRS